jgi:uncharacterized cupin superfamily protein
MRAVAHWDDVESETEDLGVIGGAYQQLSGPLGAVRTAVNRMRVAPGKAATPQHAEDEELFYMLGGSGWSVQEDGCFAIAEGDAVYYAPFRVAHSVVAGDDGLDVLAMGFNGMPATVRFPRLNKVLLSGHLLEGETTHQWELEAQLPRIEVKDPPDPRPETIVNVADAPARRFELGAVQAESQFLGRALGARRLALNRTVLQPGSESAPPHCHSAVEETFVVLDGDGVVVLGDEEYEVRGGSVVVRPAGSGVAHVFRAGERGLTFLAFSDADPNDMVFYPRSGKVLLRGLGITIRPEIVPWAD